MGDFFKSVKFKILLAILIVMFAFMIKALATGGSSTLIANFVGLISTPIQSVTSGIDNSVGDFFSQFFTIDNLKEENEQLKKEIQQLNQRMVDFETYKNENLYLKEYLEIKEEHSEESFEFVPSTVIGVDPENPFNSFTIDKGELDGISQKDTVITADGLVGIVSEVGLTYSKVTTILDISIDVGAKDARTGDIGIVAGSPKLSPNKQTKMSHIPKVSGVGKGDIIITTGVGGIYPEGLIIGKVSDVQIEEHGKSLYAVIEPAANMDNIREVLVITNFLGQDNSSSQPSSQEDTDEG